MVIVVLAALGLIFGSFINAFTWRLHEGKDWVNGRSECTHCHHKLEIIDLVPVVSWVLLRGRCRYCHKKIDDSPVVELVLPVLFVASYYFWPMSFHGAGLGTFLLWLVLLIGFLALSVYDLRWFILPNKVVFALVPIAAGYVVAQAVYKHDWRSVLSSLLGVLVISGTFYIIFQLSQGKWIGGGDVKLGIVLGLVSGGILSSFLLLFIASLSGLIATLPLMVQGKAHQKSHVPFGPFLILGMIIVVLFGSSIINWYMNLINV